MFALVTNWLTPTQLFVFLNIMIVTIALASRFGSHNKPVLQEDQPHAPPPSLLQRVKPIDYLSSFYKFPPAQDQEPEYTITRQHDQPHLERAPSLLERVKSINLSSLCSRSEHEEAAEETGSGSSIMENHDDLDHVKRSKSGKMEKRRAQQMKKSASEKGMSLELAEEVEREKVERRRPATTRSSKKTLLLTEDHDEGVDGKADDFIYKFKQQLKLQRLDSLLRYKEVLAG